MIHNIAQYLDASAARYPRKAAYIDDRRELTFSDLRQESCHIAQALYSLGFRAMPVVVYLEKSVECIAAFTGISRAGCFYSAIDIEMPAPRIQKIMETLKPAAVITDQAHLAEAGEFSGDCPVLIYEQCMENTVDQAALDAVLHRTLDTELLYVLFTSGSTGTPKGVMVTQKGIIDFTEWASEELKITSDTIWGEQAPFYFSASAYDIYTTLKTGATTCIIDKKLFSFPGLLMQYLYDHHVNTLNWVPSAMCMVSALDALKEPFLPELKNVFFGAEVMPVKQLNRWMDAYPDARYINLYGPTEVTDTCTFYEINRRLDNKELLPIGVPCNNKGVLILSEDNELVPEGEVGELCVRGSGIAYGYYNDPERTSEVFIQNPLNKLYPEIIYKTGDLVRYNERHELVYVSRKDFQIKHMGQRIELGEIETIASSLEGVDRACCLYDQKRSKIVMFYTGTVDKNTLRDNLKKLLPAYMIPNKEVKLEEMPFNLNCKIDRQKLKELM